MPRLTAAAIASGTLADSEQPVIAVGSGAALRPWKLTDAEAVVQAFADPDIQRWHVRSAESEDEARGWITTWQRGWAAETEANWALADSSTDVLLGRMSLKGIDLHDGAAGLAYWMVPSARGQGLCTQAAQSLCRWAFNTGFHRIGLEHSVANEASCRVAVNAGFAAEGIQRGSALHADGWHDMHIHARLAGDPDEFANNG